MNQTPVGSDLPRRDFRLCLALGGRCYSYYGHKLTNARTVLPGNEMMPWHLTQLAPFYAMVSEIQPWLEGARPVSPVGVVFSENTRLRYKNYDRGPYIAELQKLTESCLARSLPLEFVNRLDLGDANNSISRFTLLVLPLTSGLKGKELDRLTRYAREGGSLLVAGDALRHGEEGTEQRDFALADLMGVHFAGSASAKKDLDCEDFGFLPRVLPSARVRQFIQVRPSAGETLLSLRHNGVVWPLVRVNRIGIGRIAYLASLDSADLTRGVIERLAGPLPVTVSPAGKNPVIVTHQPQAKRWIVHLISDGDYTLHIDRGCVPASKVVDRYPQSGWNCRESTTPTGLQLEIRGGAQGRLLVLE
jgi:hypothetical protein